MQRERLCSELLEAFNLKYLQEMLRSFVVTEGICTTVNETVLLSLCCCTDRISSVEINIILNLSRRTGNRRSKLKQEPSENKETAH